MTIPPPMLDPEGGLDPLDVLEYLLRTTDPKTMRTEVGPFRQVVKVFAREAGLRGYDLSAAENEVRRRMQAATGRIPDRRLEWLTERLVHTCRTWYVPVRWGA